MDLIIQEPHYENFLIFYTALERAGNLRDFQSGTIEPLEGLELMQCWGNSVAERVLMMNSEVSASVAARGSIVYKTFFVPKLESTDRFFFSFSSHFLEDQMFTKC